MVWCMYKKFLLFTITLMLSGCSMDTLMALTEVNKTKVVKKSTYVKHYKAYFTRNNLLPVENKKTYLYFYNKKEKDLSLLMHRSDRYILHSLYHPEKSAFTLGSHSYTKLKTIEERLLSLGYRRISLNKIGATSKASETTYKEIKTLLVEVKDYSQLQKVYKRAISNYDTRKVRKIKTILPKVLISHYYKTYLKKAKKQKQIDSIKYIGDKLRLDTSSLPARSISSNEKPPVKKKKKKKKVKAVEKKHEEKNLEVEIIKVDRVIKKKAPAPKPYTYYLNSASSGELKNYLNQSESKRLTAGERNMLKAKLVKFKDDKILKNGSLEDIISAYKTNNDPRFKNKIIILMKEAQEKE